MSRRLDIVIDQEKRPRGLRSLRVSADVLWDPHKGDLCHTRWDLVSADLATRRETYQLIWQRVRNLPALMRQLWDIIRQYLGEEISSVKGEIAILEQVTAKLKKAQVQFLPCWDRKRFLESGDTYVTEILSQIAQEVGEVKDLEKVTVRNRVLRVTRAHGKDSIGRLNPLIMATLILSAILHSGRRIKGIRVILAIYAIREKMVRAEWEYNDQIYSELVKAIVRLREAVQQTSKRSRDLPAIIESLEFRACQRLLKELGPNPYHQIRQWVKGHLSLLRGHLKAKDGQKSLHCLDGIAGYLAAPNELGEVSQILRTIVRLWGEGKEIPHVDMGLEAKLDVLRRQPTEPWLSICWGAPSDEEPTDDSAAWALKQAIEAYRAGDLDAAKSGVRKTVERLWWQPSDAPADLLKATVASAQR